MKIRFSSWSSRSCVPIYFTGWQQLFWRFLPARTAGGYRRINPPSYNTNTGRLRFPFDEIEPSVLWQLQQYSGRECQRIVSCRGLCNERGSRPCFRLGYLPAYCFREGEERGSRESISSRIYIGSKEREKPDRKIGQEKDLENLTEQMEDIESEIIRKHSAAAAVM